MKISYNWLKQYLDVNLDPKIIAELLTDTGLEVESVKKVESIKGNLQGVIIGKVLSKKKHPNADRLNVATINIGTKQSLNIVCGAPNLSIGQKVPVATVGTTLYDEGKAFKIKKSKIRGELSEGMICSENELGLGTNHDGIMVLDEDAIIGITASEHFKLENDTVFEIGLTPNRSDAMSHIGVARDLLAALRRKGEKKNIKRPDVSDFKINNTNTPINVEIKDDKSCPRYAGVSISGIKIAPSPNWLKKRLTAIGLTPINNVVDITNYVLHETGQPLHAFDITAIKGRQIIIQKLDEKTKFVTLDEVERELSSEDLMICNGKGEGMCIAGVFGGLNSGVNDNTSDIFLESAYFNPISIRKTAKRHGLNTDASFRFERGADPDIVIYALKRAALLIQEVAGGSISSKITDIYPNPISNCEVDLLYDKIDSVIGEKLDRKIIQSILIDLEIKILNSTKEKLKLSIPTFRTDVQRPEDVIEEILRIYGYNNINIPIQFRSSITYKEKTNSERLQNIVSNLLSNNGFNECINNSLTKTSHIESIKKLSEKNQVSLINPLSQELNGMRQSLLFSGLENISYNLNRRNNDLKLYEFGKTYHKYQKYTEKKNLMLLASGRKQIENWNNNNNLVNLFWLKEQIEHVLIRLGINGFKLQKADLEYLINGHNYYVNKKVVATLGCVNKNLCQKFDVKKEVLYANFEWDQILELCQLSKTQYQPISKFQAARRDLALLIDKKIEFSTLKSLAKHCEKKLLKKVNLFDVYEGEKIPKGKKSYALSFILQNEHKTMTDQEIEKVMSKLIKVFEEKAGAEIRM